MGTPFLTVHTVSTACMQVSQVERLAVASLESPRLSFTLILHRDIERTRREGPSLTQLHSIHQRACLLALLASYRAEKGDFGGLMGEESQRGREREEGNNRGLWSLSVSNFLSAPFTFLCYRLDRTLQYMKGPFCALKVTGNFLHIKPCRT